MLISPINCNHIHKYLMRAVRMKVIHNNTFLGFKKSIYRLFYIYNFEHKPVTKVGKFYAFGVYNWGL